MTARLFLLLLVACAVSVSVGTARAHEVRPGLLELKEDSDGNFNILWKQPLRAGARLALDPVLPASCRRVAPPQMRITAGSVSTEWRVHCGVDGLAGETVSVAGLDRTLTDVFVRISFADGSSRNAVLRAESPILVVSDGAAPAVMDYVPMGVEHILSGPDHLLFVLALLLVSRGQILWTLSAFTLAHSLTLGLSALGLVRPAQAPIEILIALSIVLLALEMVRSDDGTPGLLRRKPWLAALTFGLLHGFGFAGALAQIGLPDDARLLALLSFNLGVEIGQLLVVGTVLLIIFAVQRMVRISPVTWLRLPAAYVIGSVAMFWVLERMGSIV